MNERRTRSRITDQNGERKVYNVYAVDCCYKDEDGELVSTGAGITAFNRAAAVRRCQEAFGTGQLRELGFETGKASWYIDEDEFEGHEEIAYIMCGWVTKED